MTTKKQKQPDVVPATGTTTVEVLTPLLDTLRQLIADSRQQVLRSVDVVQVQTYWHVGRHIVEFEQGGAQRAAYGRGLLTQLGQTLTAEFGAGLKNATCATCERSIRRSRIGTHCVPN